jgi:hypothetical protein
MAQLPNRGGGDTHSAAAKAAAAQREEQIVALRLRHVSFAAIGRQLGVSKVACIKAFYKALRANTKTDIQTIHRTELADLDLLEARAWQVIADHGADPYVVLGAINAMTRLHGRRARLMGLDAPQKIDIRAMYGTGTDEQAADRLMRQRVFAAMPVEAQIRWLEDYDAAKQSLDDEGDAQVETTGKLIDGPDRNTDDDADHHEE